MQSAMALDFEERTATLRRLLCLPPVSSPALDALLSDHLSSAVSYIVEHGPSTPGTSDIDSPQQAQRTTTTSTGLSATAAGLLSKGVATCDQDTYTRRLRAIALCGWALETLSTPAVSQSTITSSDAGIGGVGGNGMSTISPAASTFSCRVGPESAMLSCALCGAKAGLWAFFPDSQPVPLAPPRSTTTPHQHQTRKPAAAGANGGGGTRLYSPTVTSPNNRGNNGGGIGGGAFIHNVCFTLETTIAGGAMTEDPKTSGGGGGSGSKNGGPFGNSNNSRPFGAAAPAPSFLPPSSLSGARARGREEVPVFGFAALRAAEPTDTASALQENAAKRRREDDAFWAEALGMSNTAEKRPREGEEPLSTGLESTAAAAAAKAAAVPAKPTAPPPPPPRPMAPPSQATLQQCRAMRAEPLDPLTLHRRFCPWVHATPAEHAVPCGWQWCAQQLGPEGEQMRGGSAVGAAGAAQQGDQSEDIGGSGGWDPSAVLRSTLAKVQVKRT